MNFINRNPYNPAWKSQNYGSNFQKPYSNPAGAPNNNNNNNNNNNVGANHGNLPMIKNTLKAFMQAQTEQNNTCRGDDPGYPRVGHLTGLLH